MIGQSKINAFFKRQSSSGHHNEDRMKTASNNTSESTLNMKRKRDKDKPEVSLQY